MSCSSGRGHDPRTCPRRRHPRRVDRLARQPALTYQQTAGTLSFMMRPFVALFAAVVLVACGGGDDEPATVADLCAVLHDELGDLREAEASGDAQRQWRAVGDLELPERMAELGVEQPDMVAECGAGPVDEYVALAYELALADLGG